MKLKMAGIVLAVLAVTGAWAVPDAFASISTQDVEKIVQKEYPGATVRHIEREYDDGYKVYEVDFQTDSIWDGELTIDAETGRILERDIDDGRHCNTRRGHQHRNCR